MTEKDLRTEMEPEIVRQRRAYRHLRAAIGKADKATYKRLTSMPATKISEMSVEMIFEFMVALSRLSDWYGNYECTLAAWHHVLHLAIDDNFHVLRKLPEFKNMTNPQKDDILCDRYPQLNEWRTEMLKVEVELFRLGVMPGNRNCKSARIREIVQVLKKRHDALISNGHK